MRPGEVLRRAGDYLERHGVEDGVPTAERLLAQVLGTDRTGLYARRGLTSQEAKAFGRILCRRCAGEPLQHLTGEQGFRRLVLGVRPDVFIPRPETEVLVQAALDGIDGIDVPIVVDVATGSGAVALAIKDERADADVFATDIAPAAVRLARENAASLGLEVVVVEGDLLDRLPDQLRGRVHLVVANPPYVSIESKGSLSPEVLAEPSLAVFGDIDLYERLFAAASRWLRPGGLVAVEIEESAAVAVSRAARVAGYGDVSVRQDLTGRDRVVGARRP